jgi:hypothetical protein
MEMKMKKTLLSIALLTIAGTMNASLVSQLMSGPGEIPQDMLPTDDMQKQAASLYKEVTSLRIDKDGASVHIPADVATLVQNTLSVIPKNAQESSEIENLHLAYVQIQFPYMRDQLTKLMGGNSSFMDALKKYDAAYMAHNMLYGQLWQDMTIRPGGNMDFSNLWQSIDNGNVTGAQAALKQIMSPVTVPAKQQATAEETLKKVIDSQMELNKQLAQLQDMFKKANGKLGEHLAKIEYLVKQNIRWIIAMGMAINPDFKKELTPDKITTLHNTLTNLHTSPKVAAAKTELATLHATKMMKH